MITFIHTGGYEVTGRILSSQTRFNYYTGKTTTFYVVAGTDGRVYRNVSEIV